VTAPLAAPLALVALISGRGSNLQAIIDASQRGEIPAVIRAVISNQADAYGLQRARMAGIPTEVLDHRRFRDRTSFDRALMDVIDRYGPDLVVLAGFMRVLGREFVAHYRGRAINIHPSLLPAFRGLDTHRRALEAGVQEHGASVHFVTDELDGGPVITQARVAVLPQDSPETLAARVLEQEHRILPQVIRWFAEGRVKLVDGRAWLDGQPAFVAAARKPRPDP
jgi:phosphoribosylglycinamide formyltransferase-1